MKSTKSCLSCFVSAGSGWFGSFHHLYNFQSVQLSGADQKTEKQLPAMIQKLTEGGHMLDQIFNFDETGVCHKRMHLM